MANITVTSTRINAYMCPSDGGNTSTTGIGQTLGTTTFLVTSQNYVANFGNISHQQGTPGSPFLPYYVDNGITYNFLGSPFADVGAPLSDIAAGGGQGATAGIVRISTITDGLSNTMMFSEVIVGTTGSHFDLRGFSHWAYGASFSGFLTPNTSKPDLMQGIGYCMYDASYRVNPPCAEGPNGLVMTAARSRHAGGVNVAFCDGSVKFIKNSVSPLTYMALSSARGGEVISSDAY